MTGPAEIIDTVQAWPAIVGAAGGGLGVAWLARFLFRRMIKQYDDLHEKHAKRLEKTAEKFDASITDIRIKIAVAETKIETLDGDVGVAHRRIEMLAAVGGTDISGIQKPDRRLKNVK